METNSHDYSIELITGEDVLACGYKPDPHTVSLKDHGDWYCLNVNGKRVSFLCIREQRGELYIGEVFTAKEHRRKGYFFALLDFVCNHVYPEYSISTHALLASKGTFEKCGFKQFAFREFKYGNQWWLRRNGKKYE